MDDNAADLDLFLASSSSEVSPDTLPPAAVPGIARQSTFEQGMASLERLLDDAQGSDDFDVDAAFAADPDLGSRVYQHVHAEDAAPAHAVKEVQQPPSYLRGATPVIEAPG